jgi:hypothetical protein
MPGSQGAFAGTKLQTGAGPMDAGHSGLSAGLCAMEGRNIALVSVSRKQTEYSEYSAYLDLVARYSFPFRCAPRTTASTTLA